MVELQIQIQQVGGFLVMQYHAAENSTTSEPEKQEVKDMVATLQERVAKRNGAGNFVENDPGADDGDTSYRN